MRSKSRRFLSLLLCAVLTLSLLTLPVHAAEDHDHEVSVLSAQSEGTSGVPSGECSKGGAHEWVLGETHKGTVCPGADVGTIRCKKCGEERGSTADEHLWNNWEITVPAGCETSGSRTRRCTREGCNEVVTEEIRATGHTYKTVTVAATATTCPVTYKQCTVCGHTDGVTTPEAHNWVKTSNDCTVMATCSKCGTKDTTGKTYVMHSFGGAWYHDASGHWQKCQHDGCEVTSTVAAHTAKSVSGDCTQGSVCRDCGYTGLTGQQHDFSTNWVVSLNASGHVVRCANPGCTVTKTVAHTPGTADKCTDSIKCTVCNYTITPGGSHAFGPISGGDNLGCIRECAKCGAVEHVSHTGVNDDSDCTTAVKCTACGYVLVPAYSGHDYSSTIWYSGGESGHYTTCVHPGCKFTVTQPHSGGTATCASAATCAVCGASYGAKDARNHTGGTEIRNAKAAAVGVPGYTGDTYCPGCNVKLSSGSVIPALTPEHTHSYASEWKKDSTGHWHECECGDKKDFSAHTFKDGKCSVCGETDPGYGEPEAHIHTYSGVWSGDSRYHWHQCTVCGERADQDVHRFLNGVCLECGMTFTQREEEEKKEQEPAAPEKPGTPFNDVSADAWYAEPVAFVAKAGIMYGVEGGNFDPEGKSTRGTLMVMLARHAGADTEGCDPWYAKGVAWAMSAGISDGSNPEGNITRQEIVTLLYRYAGSHRLSADLSRFIDSGSIESWARNAMEWAVAMGILQGNEYGALSPTATATRAEIATMLFRFLNLSAA